MGAYTYPGVYIEELSSGQNTISGVATSIGAFIGWAAQGPVDQAVLIESWPDFQATFGGLDSRSWLGYAVNQFFANGGDQTYVIRLVWDGTIPGGVNGPTACATALANGAGYGIATVTAALSNVTGSISLGVGTPVLQSIAIVPANVTSLPATPVVLPPLPSGGSLALAAIGSLSDSSSGAPPNVQWTSSDTNILTVTPAGVVSAAGKGTATITATSGLISGTLAITATNASLSSIAVTPASVTVAVGQTAQLSVTASYSDTTSANITSIAVLTPSVAAAVSFTSTAQVPLAPGEFVAEVATPALTVSAALPASWTLTNTPTVTTAALAVEPVIMTRLVITPANATVPIAVDLAAGQTQLAGFVPVPAYSGAAPAGSPAFEWTSSDPAVAKVDAALGTLSVEGTGSTTITATYTSATTPPYTVTASTTLNVVAVELKGMSISPPTLTLAGGQSQQLSVSGVYSDGSSLDLTGFATWTTNGANKTQATVSPTGVVTAAAGIAAQESVTVQAAWLGVTATAALTVLKPVIESIAVTTNPAATSITPGQNLALIATATYSDKTTGVVTNSATWTPASPLVTMAGPGIVSAAGGGGSLTLFASSPGIWGNSLRIGIGTSAVNPGKFNLLLQQVGASGQLKTLESYVNLSVQPSDPNYVVAVINNDSAYLTFTNPQSQTNVVPTATPAATASPVALSGGLDGTVLTPNDGNFELALTTHATAGYQLLERVTIFNLLCIPGETDAPTISTLQEYCWKKRAFMIVDSPQNTTIANMIQSGPVGSTPGSITGEYATNAAQYFPWVQAPDPLVGNRTATFPPCGFVAGIYAATDASRGVWKAPAGINAGLTGNSGLQFVLTDTENGDLNPQAVNCLRQFKVYGDVVWGSRTLAGNDQAGSQWKYVPIRRLALYLESSLYDGTQWVVFEPNDATLWGQIRLDVGTFLQGLFLQGAFAGTTPAQAYFVKCDGENNPPSSVALGVVNILVGFAPLYPAEFVVIQIQQMVATS